MTQPVMEPPLYFAEDHLFDLDFHPSKDILACTMINGWVKILGYDSENVNDLATFKHHKQSTRSCSFSPSGLNLATGSKDKSISIIDTNGNVSLHMQNTHKESINMVKFLNEEVLISGDDNGEIKVWDLKSSKCVYEGSEQSEAITGVAVPENLNFLLTSSQDGTLAVYDIRKSNNAKDKLYALSDCMEEDLTAITLIKDDKFVATSTSEGIILLFKWDWFGNSKDRILFNASTIDHMVKLLVCQVKLDENTLIIGSEDGLVRGVSVFPNKQLAILGQHEEDQNFPVTKLGISHCKRFAASLSHDSSIMFYDIQQFVQSRGSGQSTWDEYESGEEDKEVKNIKKSTKPKTEMDEENDSDDFEDESDNEKKQPKQIKKQMKGEEDSDEDDEDDDDMEDEDDSDDSDDDKNENKNKSKNEKTQKRQRLSERAQKKLHAKNKIMNFFSEF